MEQRIWRVPASKAYPQGIRYRLVVVGLYSKRVLLLFDNHAPKGPHVHRAGSEETYEFRGLEKLKADFQREMLEVKARFHEDHEDRD